VAISLAMFAAPAGGGSSLPMLLPLLLIPVLYLVMIRPQQKRQKQWQQMLGGIKPGDKVTTAGGIRGTIISLKPLRLMPTFSYACAYNPTFLRVYMKSLSTTGFAIPCDDKAGVYQRYTGDTSVPGKGEILVWQPHDA